MWPFANIKSAHGSAPTGWAPRWRGQTSSGVGVGGPGAAVAPSEVAAAWTCHTSGPAEGQPPGGGCRCRPLQQALACMLASGTPSGLAPIGNGRAGLGLRITTGLAVQQRPRP